MTAPAVETKTLEFTKTIDAPMDIVWSMLTNRDDLCDWLCSATYANGPRRINPYYSESERLQALIAAHPTPEELFDELKRTQNETIAMIQAYDKEMEKRKGYLWWMAFEVWMSEEIAIREIREIAALKEQYA